jgi:hypothetical protein
VAESKAYRVQLTYFRQTGRFLATIEATTVKESLVEIWEDIDEMRRLGRLPGLRAGAGRDLFVVVDVPEHPQRVLHMVMPAFVDEDDVTPARIPTGEMLPLVRMHLEDIPRTSTRDIVRPEPETSEEITPVDHTIPKGDDDSSK